MSTQTQTPARPATAAQLRFIGTLAAERGVTPNVDGLGVREASTLIDSLRAMPRTDRTPRATATQAGEAAPAAPLAPGVYANARGTFAVYKARGKTHMLAKLLTITDETIPVEGAAPLHVSGWEYAGAAGRFVSAGDRLPLDHVTALGLHFHNCGMCGRGLTDPESQRRGIGPECASK